MKNSNFIKDKENKTKNYFYFKNKTQHQNQFQNQNSNKNTQTKFLGKKRTYNKDYINYNDHKGNKQLNKPLSNFQNNQIHSPKSNLSEYKEKSPIKNFEFDKDKIRNKNISKFYFYQKLLSMKLIKRKNYKYDNNEFIPCLPFE